MKLIIYILVGLLLTTCTKIEKSDSEMSGAITGVGTIFYRWTNGDWSPIAEVRAIVGPAMSKDTINVTSLDTAEGYNEFTSGFINGGEISLALSFTRENYELFKQDFESADSQYYGILLPDDEETFIDFIGLVTEVPIGITSDDKIDVNVKIQVSGVLEVEPSSGAYTDPPDAPTALSLQWEDDYAEVTFTDNSGGTAQHEVWSRRIWWNGTDGWELVTTLNAGVTSYNDRTWQVCTVEYQIRAKRSGMYSAYCSSESIVTPWVFKMDQTTLQTVVIDDIHLYAVSKLVVIDWGDGTSTNVTAVTTNPVSKDYTVQGNYFVKISGDMDYLNFLHWDYPVTYTAGTDVTKWTLPYRFQASHLKLMGLVGVVSDILYNPFLAFLDWDGNDFSDWDLTNWNMPTPLFEFNASTNEYDNVHGDISTWVLGNVIAHINVHGYIWGDLTDLNPFRSTYYGNHYIRLSSSHPIGLTGDLSGWTMLDKTGHVEMEEGCHFTGMPRGHFRRITNFYFRYNSCDQAEIDSFLEYLDDYFATIDSSGEPSSEGGYVPMTNCAYWLDGAGMGIPSATGLAHITSIQAKYTAAGFTATFYVNS